MEKTKYPMDGCFLEIRDGKIHVYKFLRSQTRSLDRLIRAERRNDSSMMLFFEGEENLELRPPRNRLAHDEKQNIRWVFMYFETIASLNSSGRVSEIGNVPVPGVSRHFITNLQPAFGEREGRSLLLLVCPDRLVILRKSRVLKEISYSQVSTVEKTDPGHILVDDTIEEQMFFDDDYNFTFAPKDADDYMRYISVDHPVKRQVETPGQIAIFYSTDGKEEVFRASFEFPLMYHSCIASVEKAFSEYERVYEYFWKK